MLCLAAPEKVSALNLKRLKADNKTCGRSQKNTTTLWVVVFFGAAILLRENQGRQRRPLTWHPLRGKKGDGKSRLLFCLYAINRRGTRLFCRWDPFPVCYSDLWYHRGRRPAY